MSASGKKIRVDQLLVERGLAPTRSRAQALVLAGRVWAGDRRLDKPGQLVPADTALVVAGGEGEEWASRGALKLLAALDVFGIDPSGRVALDIGSSTGGFVDVLLRRGARRVYAVDVGKGQLLWRLRTDPRVVVLEGVNARYLDRELVPEPIELLTCDASFISLKLVLPAALALTAPAAELVALIKPQFEAGREAVGKGGVVRDPAVHARVCAEIARWLGERPGWRVLGITASPILGPAGNKEFLIAARREEPRPKSA
ncbi:MAG: TlyA family RNA methyltransferase [Geminicoccaceae bacterium]|nr:TlyA family RNA methyltransferase [Geminicoccaceae bacterium]MCX7629887.1 TlyA family RNA methyltransferase [Geminicoccaceae bacterium]MDW8124071.1 TlyA family RNA methyltransferase [Geminicoccaceae bacterium]MDW8340266.1 TlyA family RNA methyltransferase [Geminicoccaceae bacterium]